MTSALVLIGMTVGWCIGRYEAHLIAYGRQLLGGAEPPPEPQERPKSPIRARIDHRIAVHEAGHAVTAWFNPYVVHIERITLEHASTGNGQMVRALSRRRHRADARWATIATNLGGIAAEALEFGAMRSGPAANDLVRARDIAVQLIADDATKCPWTDLELDDESFDVSIMLKSIEAGSPEARILNLCYARAKYLVSENDLLMQKTVDALLQHGELDRGQIDNIFGQRLFSW